jgi:hypothetical protein
LLGHGNADAAKAIHYLVNGRATMTTSILLGAVTAGIVTMIYCCISSANRGRDESCAIWNYHLLYSNYRNAFRLRR